MKTMKENTIDDYISAFPRETQIILQEIRGLISKMVPNAEEKISYGIACFTLNNTYLIYFAGYKNHIGMYPAPVGVEDFQEDFKPYKTGKGTVQFPLKKPIPYELIKKIVEYRLKDNIERSSSKRRK